MILQRRSFIVHELDNYYRIILNQPTDVSTETYIIFYTLKETSISHRKHRCLYSEAIAGQIND